MDNLANPLYEATLKSYDRSNADEFIDNLSATGILMITGKLKDSLH